METTEVTLGADSAQTATVVNIPNTKKMLTKTVVLSAVAGATVGYIYAKKKSLDRNKTIIYSVVGGVAGFLIGKYIETRKAIKVTPSK